MPSKPMRTYIQPLLLLAALVSCRSTGPATDELEANDPRPGEFQSGDFTEEIGSKDLIEVGPLQTVQSSERVGIYHRVGKPQEKVAEVVSKLPASRDARFRGSTPTKSNIVKAPWYSNPTNVTPGKGTSAAEMSTTGVWGARDPRESTVERGRDSTEALVTSAVAFIERWNELRPRGTGTR